MTKMLDQLLPKLHRQNRAATATSEAIAELEALKSTDLRAITLIQDLRKKLTNQLKLVQATKDQVDFISLTSAPKAEPTPSTKDRQHKN